MEITKPPYYDQFRCIAGRCPDSCCKEWDVQVDSDAAARYRALPGPLGDRLRQVLRDEDGETVMTIENRRCPMWRDDGLCRIQAELGEEALCRVCREFPRLRHDYGDFLELTLELSCPEAARLILSAPLTLPVTESVSGGEVPEYDADAMTILKSTRQQVLAILSDTARPVPETLALALVYGYQAQSELDGSESAAFHPDSALESLREFAKPGSYDRILTFFRSLELLTPEWEAMLSAPSPAPWCEAHLALARYFVERYWLQAVSDYDLSGRVKFMVISCILVRHLGGDIYRTAQLYSKEIENSAENVDAILDAAYADPAFTDDRLLGLLLDSAAS